MTTWVAGNTPAAADLNRWELAYDATDARRLTTPVTPISGGPLILDLRAKAAAFTFGTAPVTSVGYFRHPDGSPWSADSIQGDPMDRTVTRIGYSSVTTPNTLLGERLYLLPPCAAMSVSKVEALIPFVAECSSGTATFSKIELVVVKIAADGTETTLGTLGSNATSAALTTTPVQLTRWVSAALGASYAIAATERLGVRLKWYGNAAAASNWAVYPLADFNAPDITSSDDYWHTKPVRFAFYVT